MTSPPIVIRDFEPTDQDAVRAVIQDGLRSRWGDAFDPGANPDTDDLAATYLVPGGEIVVVEAGGRVAATGILSIEPCPPFVPSESGLQLPRLRRISVSANHRRQGFGRLVVDELVARATDRGFTMVLVSTDTPWTDAVALYRASGFVEISRDSEETHLLWTTTDR